MKSRLQGYARERVGDSVPSAWGHGTRLRAPLRILGWRRDGSLLCVPTVRSKRVETPGDNQRSSNGSPRRTTFELFSRLRKAFREGSYQFEVPALVLEIQRVLDQRVCLRLCESRASPTATEELSILSLL